MFHKMSFCNLTIYTLGYIECCNLFENFSEKNLAAYYKRGAAGVGFKKACAFFAW
jgi:hypothetical protein